MFKSSVMIPDWPHPARVRAYITTKETIDPTLMCAHQDSRYQHEVMTQLQLPCEPIWLQQTHSSHVIKALPENQYAKADASVAFLPMHICVVLTADCLPILICNEAATVVAAIHAGWRGLAEGIIANTMNLLSEKPERLLVYLGPAIGPHCFEIGADVYDTFMTLNVLNQTAFIAKNQNKWLANIYDLAKIQLTQLGVSSHHIFGGTHCTFTEDHLFYSYRRDRGKPGRMASLIWFE